MPITILPPKAYVPPSTLQPDEDSDSDSSSGGADLDTMIKTAARRPHRRKHDDHGIVTPGEVITDDAQWMR